MKKFAKLYEHEKIGQVLALKTTNSEGHPHIRFMIEVDGNEVSGGLSYNGTDDAAWDALDVKFDEIDEEFTFEFAEKLFIMAGGEL